jgi:hypothetical protein
MPGWAKALLVVFVVGVLLVVGAIVAGAYWWTQNKDALMAKAKAQFEEGREAGRATDNQGCVDQSIQRYKREPGIAGGIASGLFVRACLDASSPTPGFCDNVPKESEFIKSGQWRAAQCLRVDLASDQYCQQLFRQCSVFVKCRLENCPSLNACRP